MAKGLRSKRKMRDRASYKAEYLKPVADRVAESLNTKLTKRVEERKAAAAAAAAAGVETRPPMTLPIPGKSKPRKQAVKYATRTVHNPKIRYYNMHNHLVSKASKHHRRRSTWTRKNS